MEWTVILGAFGLAISGIGIATKLYVDALNTRIEGFKDDAVRMREQIAELTKTKDELLSALKSAPLSFHATPDQLPFITSLQNHTATLSDGLKDLTKSSDNLVKKIEYKGLLGDFGSPERNKTHDHK